MPITFDESKKDELKIIQRGSTPRALFFFTMGLIAQILLVWGYWNFLDATGPWAFFWLGVISSELFPFFQTIFLFGGGCFLVTLREAGWTELWIIKKDLFPDSAGIQQKKVLFRWSRIKTISKNQIKTINLHIIPLDRLKLFNRYQIEIQYRLSANGPPESDILYKDDSESAKSKVFHLVQRIQEILDIEVKETEAEPPIKS
jgi:hypothetical protein